MTVLLTGSAGHQCDRHALTLLEAATRAGVGALVMTSTTSAFGAALTPNGLALSKYN